MIGDYLMSQSNIICDEATGGNIFVHPSVIELESYVCPDIMLHIQLSIMAAGHEYLHDLPLSFTGVPPTLPPPPQTLLLESLELDLGLGSLDGGCGVVIDETTSELAVLERGRLGGAHTGALAVVGTAGESAVVIGNASSGNELEALAVPDVTRPGIVGDDLG